MSIERLENVERELHEVRRDVIQLSTCTATLTENVSTLCKSMDRLSNEMAQTSRDNREQMSHMARAEEWRNQQTGVNRVLGEHLGRHDVEINDVRLILKELTTKMTPIWGLYGKMAGYAVMGAIGAGAAYLGLK